MTEAETATVEDLLEQAERLPGVAEAAAVYARFARFTAPSLAVVSTTTRFDTGANA